MITHSYTHFISQHPNFAAFITEINKQQKNKQFPKVQDKSYQKIEKLVSHRRKTGSNTKAILQ